MICNSGFLLTRKLKELVTGSGADTQPITSSTLPKKSPPVTTLNVKPISSEPVHRNQSKSATNSLVKNKSDSAFRGTSKESFRVAKERVSAGVLFPNQRTNDKDFEIKNSILSKKRSVSPKGKQQGPFSFGSLKNSRPKNSEESCARDYDTLPVNCNDIQKRDRKEEKVLPVKISDSDASSVISGTSHQSHNEASFSQYKELPRKKKKPCTNQSCFTTSHSKESTDALSHNPIDTGRKKACKPSVLQKFYSLERSKKYSSAENSSKKEYDAVSANTQQRNDCISTSSHSVAPSLSSHFHQRSPEASQEFPFPHKEHFDQSEVQNGDHVPKMILAKRTRGESLANYYHCEDDKVAYYEPGKGDDGMKGDSFPSRKEEGLSSSAMTAFHTDKKRSLLSSVRSFRGNSTGEKSRDVVVVSSEENPGSVTSHTLPRTYREVRLGHRGSNRIRNSRVPLASFEPFFCVLLQDESTFTTYRSEEMAIGDSLFYDLPRVRLDGGSKAFRRRWGYELAPPPTLLEEENEEDPMYSVPFEDDISERQGRRGLDTSIDDTSSLGETRSLREDILAHSFKDTSYEKACGSDRRGSAPATPILGARPQQDPAPNRFVNFFNKRSFKGNPLKRTKSVTKLERSKRTMAGFGGGGSTLLLGGESEPSNDQANGSLSRLRSSRSHESLLSSHQQMMHTLDMAAGEVTIKPLHPSILGQDHCFQISTPTGPRYYSCRNAEERDRWVENLRRAVNPHLDRCRRTENSLKIFVLEAKRVAAKKRYFCELRLDNALYARTSSKPKGEMCFWGEQFEFHSLPAVETITVNLYREAERRRKKEKSVPLGGVTIPVSSVTSVTSRSLHEKWYVVNSENSKGSAKDLPSLRIKCKFQSVEVLPLDMYAEFLQYVKTNYWSLCSALEPNVNVKAKEDIGTTLVQIMQREGLAKNFLADLVMMEIDRIDDAHLLFRGNSLATKAMEAFMKLVGEKYLLQTLQQVVNKIVDDGLDCEVDRTKVPQPGLLQKHQENLLKVVRATWSCILDSHSFFPKELRQCFCKYRERLEASGKSNLSDNLISASIFLRFLCPAILSPSLFNITQEYPDERTSRNLTLIAKTLQTLANFTKFQGKENFMEFMNEFIEKEQEQMRNFLKQISSPQPLDHRGGLEYEGQIDIGVQLSILHTLLCEAMQKMDTSPKNAALNQELQLHVDKLQAILDKISVALKQPNINIVQQMSADNNNDSTLRIISPRGVDSKLEEIYGGYQSLQKNIFRYNDPTIDVTRGPEQVCQSSPSGSDEPPSTPRSSTLPRTSFLLGSGRKPAADLSTADDYVLFSALDSEGRPKGPHGIAHSFSHSHIDTGQSQMNVPSNGNVLNHHHHFHNHAGWYNNRVIYNDQVGGNSTPSKKSLNRPQTNGESRGVGHEEPDRNSSGDGETNMKGSQTSISQLSNVASSGYQSFAYSQSSSPVDPSISHHDVANNNLNMNNHSNNNIIPNGTPNNRTPHQQSSPQFNSPLAFNNPMYHLNAVTSSPRAVPQSSPYTHHHHPHSHRIPLPRHQQSPVSSSLSSSHSIEDLHLRTTGNANANVNVSLRGQSTSSEDSSSLTCTPPVDLRFPYKSSAPRTNPRCAPSAWGSINGVNAPSAPEHHHSTSDLLSSSSQSRRSKTGRRMSTELGSNRRLQRRFDDSDSSSDDQQPVPPRSRSTRQQHQRISDTKTLDEYEKEILALQSSMEMHLKMVTAEEHMNGQLKDTTDLPDLSSNHQRASSRLSTISPNAVNGVAHVPGRQKGQLQTAAREGENLQMRELLKTLIESHEELMRDQQMKAEMMNEKDAVIHAQEERIAALNRSNTQLLLALTQMQSISPEITNHLKKISQDNNQLSDTSDYKSSSC